MVSPLLHRNGNHLMAIETQISCKFELTPEHSAISQGSKHISPNITDVTLGRGIK